MKRPKSQRISTTNRMILSTLAFVTVSFIVMIFIVANVMFSNSIERSKRRDTDNASRLTAMMGDTFDNTTRLLSLAQRSFAELDFYDGMAHDSVGKILTTLLELNPNAYSAWAILEPGIHHDDRHCISVYLQVDGSIIANYTGAIAQYLKNPDTAPWYYEPLRTGMTNVETLGSYDYGTGDGPVYNAIISVPIFGDGEIIGVCGIDLLYSGILNISTLHESQNRVAMLISQDLTILSAYDRDLVGRNIADFQFDDIDGLRGAISRGEKYSKEILGPLTMEKVFLYLQPIRFVDDLNRDPLYLLISTPISALHSEAYEVVALLVTVSSICGFLILTLIFLNIRKIIRPIRMLTRQAQQITEGDFEIENFGSDESIPDNKNEVAVLRYAFIKVLQELQGNLHSVENHVQERTLELTKLNHYIRILMESTSNVSLLMDKDFHVLCCSDNLLQFLRVGSFSKIKGLHWDFILEKIPDTEYASRSRHRMQRIRSGEDRFIEDDIVTWPDGETRIYRIIYNQVRDENNNLEGIVIVMLDLTDVRLEEAQRRQDDLLRSTKVPCMVWNEKGEILALNEEFTRVFELPAKVRPEDSMAILNSFQPELQYDGRRTEYIRQKVIERAINDGFAQADAQFNKPDGTPVYYFVNVARFSWLSDHRLVVYCFDRTDLVRREAEVHEILERERSLKLQKEAAQAANEAKSQFLANMSHEIRTPMNAVLGMSELLLQENMSQRQSRYVKDIKTSAEALLGIINDILDVSKIQAGKLSLVPVHYDFRELIDNIGSIVHFIVEDKDITFNLDIQGEMPWCLYGDDLRLRQILMNLLSNAVKFTRVGNVRLTVRTMDTSLSFTVDDTGIGIRDEDLGKLFDAFEQFDAQKNHDKGGTGLGLSITKALIEMMGGSIGVVSVYGQGTSFHVEIPKVLGDNALLQSADGKDIAIYAPEAKVLVVDDNKINLNVASGLLQLCGISPETALSGREAIELVKEYQYDLVFMDHMMPEMNGLEATGIIRGLGIGTPIIALTANAIVGTSEIMIAAGMDDYLSKPIITSQMKHMLHKWLPAEKLLSPPAGASEPVRVEDIGDDVFWEKIGQIESISLSLGLSRVDGLQDVYESMLKLMIKEIEKSDRNLNEFLAVGNMRSFCIEVHGLKGSLSNIGAAELSEKARELETASSQDDISFCLLNLPSLLLNLGDLQLRLEEAFSHLRNGYETIRIPPDMPPIFDSLTDALREENIIAIDRYLLRLTAMSPSGALGEEIEQIADAVTMTDFEGAISIIEKLADMSDCA